MKTFPNPLPSDRPLLLQWLGAIVAAIVIGVSMVLGLFVFAGIAIAGLLLFLWARVWVAWRRWRGKDVTVGPFVWRFGSAARGQGQASSGNASDRARNSASGTTVEGEYRVVSSSSNADRDRGGQSES